MEKKKKVFVLDTNVVLHDSTCIHHFHEHDIVIPITVLEELDRFKKGHDTLNYHARNFLRTLDSLSGEGLFNGGVEIGPGGGRISVKLEPDFHEDLKLNFSSAKSDHHVLNTAYHLARELAESRVVLVSKDVNLRLKAKAAGLLAQDYTTDHVKDISTLYKGLRVLEDFPASIIDRLYQPPFEVDAIELPIPDPVTPNEFFILRGHGKSVLARFDPFARKLARVEKRGVSGIMPANAEQTFAFSALLNDNIRLATLSGKAGTGKTLLSLAAAIECRRNYRQIYVARPMVPLSNKDIGYLPGDIQSKLDPYMQPLYDNLGVIRHRFPEKNGNSEPIMDFLDSKKLVITPLSYIRGRSLIKIFFIVDEAQNLTPHEVKTIITRAGEGTKMVFTGDIFQIDHPYLDVHSNGLSYLIEKMKGQNLYAHINMEKGERSELAELAANLL